VSPDTSLPEASRAFFFAYISVTPSKEEEEKDEIFMLSALKVEKSVLLQIQLTLFNVWLDKLRTLTPEITKLVLHSIPVFCDNEEVLRRGGIHIASHHITVRDSYD
jgi:hypothetical protein